MPPPLYRNALSLRHGCLVALATLLAPAVANAQTAAAKESRVRPCLVVPSTPWPSCIVPRNGAEMALATVEHAQRQLDEGMPQRAVTTLTRALGPIDALGTLDARVRAHALLGHAYDELGLEASSRSHLGIVRDTWFSYDALRWVKEAGTDSYNARRKTQLADAVGRADFVETTQRYRAIVLPPALYDARWRNRRRPPLALVLAPRWHIATLELRAVHYRRLAQALAEPLPTPRKLAANANRSDDEPTDKYPELREAYTQVEHRSLAREAAEFARKSYRRCAEFATRRGVRSAASVRCVREGGWSQLATPQEVQPSPAELPPRFPNAMALAMGGVAAPRWRWGSDPL